MLINSKGTVIRIEAREINKLGRATQGVKIMKTGDDVEIISMSKVINEEERARDAELAQKLKAQKKAEAKKAEAKAAKDDSKEKSDNGSEQTMLDI